MKNSILHNFAMNCKFRCAYAHLQFAVHDKIVQYTTFDSFSRKENKVEIEIEPISESNFKRKREKWGKGLSAKQQTDMKEAIRRYKQQMDKKPNEHNGER